MRDCGRFDTSHRREEQVSASTALPLLIVWGSTEPDRRPGHRAEVQSESPDSRQIGKEGAGQERDRSDRRTKTAPPLPHELRLGAVRIPYRLSYGMALS